MGSYKTFIVYVPVCKSLYTSVYCNPSVLWHCGLGERKGIPPIIKFASHPLFSREPRLVAIKMVFGEYANENLVVRS